MKLKDLYKDRIEKMLLKFSFLLLALSVVFSFNIYLKKIHASQEQDLRQLELIRAKINRLNEFRVSLDKFSSQEIHNAEFKLAQLLDTLKKNFPELKIELSSLKKESAVSYLPFSIRGEGSFSRFLETLDYLDRIQYPVCLINSVSLKSKEKTISFEIKGEIGILK